MTGTEDQTIYSSDRSQGVKVNIQITELIGLDQTTQLIEVNLSELEDGIVGRMLKHRAELV